MKHLVDQSTGVLVLIPETEADRKTLYHLMNCSNLTEFTGYLSTCEPAEIDITEDLGVSAKDCIKYISEPVHRLPKITERAITSGRLIGFNRDSYSRESVIKV